MAETSWEATAKVRVRDDEGLTLSGGVAGEREERMLLKEAERQL